MYMKVKDRIYEELFTVEEVSGIFKLSRGSIRNLIKSGKIAAIKIGKQYRIPESVINAFYEPLQKPVPATGFAMWKEKDVPGDGAEYVTGIRQKDSSLEETLQELNKWQE